ncbi:probable G- coupled receptor 33 [Pelobates cultripes]|uniref:Probable G-protein coupled receptor 33 n=1 Tax=Pelobates cultripes TaxID=61616 RepID=A0AAD1WL46_PELCU|nr:probable G- coupled receptor 33 [Pelobates cultripes]
MSWNVTSTSTINTTTSEGTISPVIPTSNIFITLIMCITFLFGLVVNSLYLWVLGFRISKTVNSTWFFHFILANLVFTLILPFIAVYMLTYPHWILGLVMCKLLNSLMSVAMFEAVFMLTVISIDRYLLVFHPHWYRRHMTPRYATIICIFIWGLAIICSSPYIVFRQLRKEKNATFCQNDYTLSRKWDSQHREIKIKWILFTFRILVGYLLPFFVILFCYLQIALKLKKEKMARTSKPYKIITIAVLSFFVCWLPYHLWYGMSIEKGRFEETTLGVLRILTTCLTCLNFCFTPIFYLFIVDSFKKVFKKSILSLIESVLNDAFVSMNRSLEEKMQHSSSFVRDEMNVDNI